MKISTKLMKCEFLLILFTASFLQAAFQIGFYNDFAKRRDISNMSQYGSTINLPYNGGENTGVIIRYLDSCFTFKNPVIAGIPAPFVSNELTEAIIDLVAAIDEHPSTLGYYTADEPLGNGISPSLCESAYNAVKTVSDKPVFICLMNSEIDVGAASMYQNAYDIMLADSYECVVGQSEFQGLEGVNGWKQDMQDAKVAANALGKPWWPILQAIGEVDGYTWTYRLPTFSENRFMCMWSVLEGADSILYWAYYRTVQTKANATCPYVGNGNQWLVDVWEPVAFEINTYAKAIDAGPLAGAVSDNMANVNAKIYHDTTTDDYYLISLNYVSTPASGTFSINLPVTITSAQRMFESGSITVSGGNFSDSFTGYKAHVYKLLH